VADANRPGSKRARGSGDRALGLNRQFILDFGLAKVFLRQMFGLRCTVIQGERPRRKKGYVRLAGSYFYFRSATLHGNDVAMLSERPPGPDRVYLLSNTATVFQRLASCISPSSLSFHL